MTTTSVIAAGDLFVENDVFQLDRSALGARSADCNLAAISCLSRRGDGMESWSKVCRRAALSALGVMRGNGNGLENSLLLYVSDDVWRSNNRISRRKGLWNASPRLACLKARLASVGPEIALERDGVIRFAAVAEISAEQFADGVEFIRESGSSFLLVNNSEMALTKETAQNLSTKSQNPLPTHERETGISWASLACSVCPGGDVLVRASGSHDERDAAVDLIYDPRVISLGGE